MSVALLWFWTGLATYLLGFLDTPLLTGILLSDLFKILYFIAGICVFLLVRIAKNLPQASKMYLFSIFSI
jgi:hypothetical protein